MSKYRINRALALAGVASRRKAEEFVKNGRVVVNGRKVTELATEVDIQQDEIKLDGRILRVNQEHCYYLYYKPRGLICTMKDVSDRPCIGEICRELTGSPRPVGRLDRKSEGLMLLTNDGEMANHLTHPSYGVHKEYLVTISPALQDNHAEQMTDSVPLKDGAARFVGIQLIEQQSSRTRAAVVVDEGRNKLVRRVFAYYGYDVLRLKRSKQGQLSIGAMKPGEIRQLKKKELANLRRSLKLPPE